MTEHCWHRQGVSGQTMMMGANKGYDNVICCKCGELGTQLWHEEARQIEGHGPHVKQIFKVVDRVDTSLDCLPQEA